MPPATFVVGERAPDDLLPIGTTFDDVDGLLGFTLWNGALNGLMVVEPSRSDLAGGTCYALVGALTPTSLDEDSTSPSIDWPVFAALSEGSPMMLNLANRRQCDVSSLEDAGYHHIRDAEVTAGTPYPFFVDFFVPGRNATVDSIVVGQPFDEDSLYLEPTILDAVPSP